MAGAGGNKGAIDPGSGIGQSPYTDDIGTTEFNFGGKPPIEFIQFLLGDSIFELFGDRMLNEAFERAFVEISDILLEETILAELGGSGRYVSSDNTVYDDNKFSYKKRILKVLRQNTADEDTTANDQYYYDCRKVQNVDSQAINPNSIYYENDPFNPAWYVSMGGGINILPKDSSTEPTGKVYYMSYPIFGIGTEIDILQTHNLGQLTGWQNFSLVSSDSEGEIFHGIPYDARNGIYYTMAANLIDGYLSNHIQDDEDIELVNLLKAQIESILFMKNKELVLIQNKYGVPQEPQRQ